MKTLEEWVQIKKHPYYEISSCGRARSWKNNRWGWSSHPKTLKHGITKNGYPLIVLHNSEGRKTASIHQLVLTHFGPPKPSGKHEVCHNDGVKVNNHIDNLRWGTRKENCLDKIKHGTNNTGKGSNHGNAKLIEKEVIWIKEYLNIGVLQKQIASLFGVSKSAIGSISRGVNWA